VFPLNNAYRAQKANPFMADTPEMTSECACASKPVWSVKKERIELDAAPTNIHRRRRFTAGLSDNNANVRNANPV
jgi:hypothetical protein